MRKLHTVIIQVHMQARIHTIDFVVLYTKNNIFKVLSNDAKTLYALMLIE